MRESKQHSVIVEARGLTRAFRDFWMRTRALAVDRLDLDIRAGEVFGLLGPNGSGKSTTIKMILGLLRPTSGRLAVFGRPPTDVAVKKYIGFLPEETYLYRYLTPLETLDYYGRLFGIRRTDRRRRSSQLLEMVGLSGVAHRRVGEFSKGMMRRIGLAQALVNDPDLLILDEPTSGLDPIGTRQVKDLILDLKARGKTILLSSHLLGDVQDVCDRMVMLYGGRVRASGTVQSLLQDTNRTVIRTGRLDASTIERIEEILRASGEAIEQIESPRQRLEDLFMALVEQARHEQLETSGATEGGQTAEFLRDADQDPASLIEQLQQDQQPVAVATVRGEKDDSAQRNEAKRLVDQLTTSAPRKEKSESQAGPSVDRSMIDALTDTPDSEERDQ